MKLNKTHYVHFSNDFDNKTGIITVAIKLTGTKDYKNNFRVGFHFTPPNTKFTPKHANTHALSEIMMNSNLCTTMLGRDMNEEILHTARLAWILTGKFIPNIPDWAIKLNLNDNACIID